MITTEELLGMVYLSRLPRGNRRTVIGEASADDNAAAHRRRANERAQKRRWYLKNRERQIAKNVERRRANPDKARAWRKKWALANPEKVRAQARRAQRKAYAANAQKRLESARAYYARNREKRLAYMREYHIKNREAILTRRRAAK